MAKKPTVLEDSEIMTRVLAKASDSVGWYDSKLSRERERVLNYYNGLYPKRSSDGSSSYISTDVYDSVETLKATLLETFSGSDNIAQFDPDQDMAINDCRIATEYARYVIFRENPGHDIFGGIIHDGLNARAGIAKVYWETKHDYSDEEFEGLPYDDAHALASHDEIDEFDGTHDPDDNTYAGTLTRKKDVSHTVIDNIAPEEFIIAPRSKSIAKATYCGHRTMKTKAELLDMGYKKKIIQGLPSSSPKDTDFSPEALARNNVVESNSAGDDPIQKELEVVLFYESYVRMQIDTKKGVRLYKICHVGDTMLDEYEEIDKAPFITYIPLPIPHLFYGNNFAARVIPTQNARTVLMRGVLDHTAITTNPRWQVVNGGLMNPREMLENRMGGLVNVRRPDSVTALPQNPLNPYVMNVMALLTENNEKSTGQSALSTGMNKDAISTQNSSALIDSMMKASGQRAKIAARNFAYGFFVPLMIEVVRLGILHDKKRVIDVAGEPMQVDPATWAERKTASVSMHLGYGEQDKLAAEIEGAYEKMSKDPSLAQIFTLENKFAMITDAFKAKRFPRGSMYITEPSKTQPPGPDPFKTRELDIKQQLATAALQQGNAANDKNQKLLAVDSERLNVEKSKLQLTAMDHDRTNDRHDLDTASRIDEAHEKAKAEREKLASQERIEYAKIDAMREAKDRADKEKADTKPPVDHVSNNLGALVQELARANKPKKLVRDDNGKIVGIE